MERIRLARCTRVLWGATPTPRPAGFAPGPPPWVASHAAAVGLAGSAAAPPDPLPRSPVPTQPCPRIVGAPDPKPRTRTPSVFRQPRSRARTRRFRSRAPGSPPPLTSPHAAVPSDRRRARPEATHPDPLRGSPATQPRPDSPVPQPRPRIPLHGSPVTQLFPGLANPAATPPDSLPRSPVPQPARGSPVRRPKAAAASRSPSSACRSRHRTPGYPSCSPVPTPRSRPPPWFASPEAAALVARQSRSRGHGPIPVRRSEAAASVHKTRCRAPGPPPRRSGPKAAPTHSIHVEPRPDAASAPAPDPMTSAILPPTMRR
ncbi:hypothetical protein DFR70_11778 [Nocardia tenerifensis]|uniref:Uncharacterized protein n=1 Tax=Nocardia tenerifensis TaxID=228006 RepID=A0A318K4B9_9NOCA|nr:hypothetical protein DFR70_11778 [Nocardia tenerifensis]